MVKRHVLAFLLICAVARADRLGDIARIHLEALGGAERISALTAVRATGAVVTGGSRVHFNLTAARPNRLRMEIEAGGRTKVQGYDGLDVPWEFDTGVWPPRYKPMPDTLAKSFAADSEFDDPLVSGPAGGYVFDDGGEVKAGGRTLVRLMVTRKLRDTFSLLLDPETYLIAMRIETRESPAGRTLQIVTRFDDYRPVQGVLLAHRITVAVEGKISQETLIEQIEPIPTPKPETFTRPKASATTR